MEPGLQRILSESSDLSLKTAMVFFIKTTTCKKNVLFSGSLHPTFSYFLWSQHLRLVYVWELNRWTLRKNAERKRNAKSITLQHTKETRKDWQQLKNRKKYYQTSLLFHKIMFNFINSILWSCVNTYKLYVSYIHTPYAYSIWIIVSHFNYLFFYRLVLQNESSTVSKCDCSSLI